MPLKIDYKKCCWKDGKCSSCGCGKEKACVGCVEACPVDALSRKKKLEINRDLCIECGACIAACKHDALTLE
jgi:ferredoxin